MAVIVCPTLYVEFKSGKWLQHNSLSDSLFLFDLFNFGVVFYTEECLNWAKVKCEIKKRVCIDSNVAWRMWLCLLIKLGWEVTLEIMYIDISFTINVTINKRDLSCTFFQKQWTNKSGLTGHWKLHNINHTNTGQKYQK